MLHSPPQRHRTRAGGFTLIELLVVIGILVVLASILIPTISHVRISVHQANTASRVTALTNAIENYFHTFNAYPGPAADSELLTVPPSNNQKLLAGAVGGIQVTGTENLTLALMGGLRLKASVAGSVPDTALFVAEECGKGSLGLNPNKPAQRYGPFIEPKLGGLDAPTSSGGWVAWNDPSRPGGRPVNATAFGDTIIPEFVDAYPDPLPILYIRARLGASGSIIGAKDTSGNAVLTPNDAYDPGQLQYYVFPAVMHGTGQTPTPLIANNAFPNQSIIDPQVLNDFNQTSATPPITPANYFGQYLAPSVPRSKGYLLITAGPDRLYMTKDDTINNGSAVK